MNHLDLFSGIGGFALAASWVWGGDHNVVAFCEIDPFCQKVLKKHWPGVPIHDDIRTYKHDGTAIDLVTAGYPCQPFSTASHGKIVAKDLSEELIRAVKTIQPECVCAENVQQRTILGATKQLQVIGYDAECYNLAAFDFGAPHVRSRWFCVAHTDHKIKLHRSIYAKMEKLQGVQDTAWGWENYARTLRIPNGVPNRVDRLKSLGNAIVPQVVVPIMEAIKCTESQPSTSS